MKAIKIMMFVAAAAMLFAACGKDDNVVAGDNELVFDGKVYQMEAFFGPINGSMGLMEIHSVDKDANGDYLISTTEEMFHIYHDILGNEIDLTSIYSEWPGYHLVLVGAVNIELRSYQVNDESYVGGNIQGTEYDNTPAFKSGTMKISLEGDNMIFALNGDTKNDHKISMRIVTPANGWSK